MKTDKKSIESFFETRHIAIAGVSRNPKKFGNVVYQELKTNGYTVYQVNPNVSELNGEVCYKSVSELPPEAASLLIATSKGQTLQVLKDAVTKGIRNIWIQQMSETKEAIEFARSSNITPIMKECIFMFAEPVKGFHKFHRNIKKFFGALPK